MLMDRQTGKNEQTNERNYTNLERNLAIMVIYLPVKFGLNSIRQSFSSSSPETKCRQTDIGHINLIGGLVTGSPPKNQMNNIFEKI